MNADRLLVDDPEWVVLGGCHGIFVLPRAQLGGYLRGCLWMMRLSLALAAATVIVLLGSG